MEHTRLNEHLERHFKGGVYYSCVINEEAGYQHGEDQDYASER